MPSFRVPESKIRLTYDRRADPTGGGPRLVWIATDGKRRRGVVITVPHILEWGLKPNATDAQLPAVVAQLATRSEELRAATRDADTFFAGEGDLEVKLPVEQNDWDPTAKSEA